MSGRHSNLHLIVGIPTVKPPAETLVAVRSTPTSNGSTRVSNEYGTLVEVPTPSCPWPAPNIAVLFQGTGSVGKVFEEAGHEVVSLDILEKFQPTHVCDILDFDYKQYPCTHFDIIWASPECKVYSQLQTTNIGAHRKYKTRQELDDVRQEHSKYVERVLEIIEYFDPVEWYIENPYFSAMRDLPCMKGLTSYRFDYCRFGFLYQKPTRIWTNRTDLEDRTCACASKQHRYSIGITSTYKLSKGAEADESRTEDRYRIPEELLRYLFWHRDVTSI